MRLGPSRPAQNRSSPVAIRSVAYDAATRTVALAFDALDADRYEITVAPAVRSADGLDLAAPYSGRFTAVADMQTVVALTFSRARASRADQTVSYDVTVTNISRRDLLLPLVLELAPSAQFDGVPEGTIHIEARAVGVGQVEINFYDDGKGMTEEVQRRAFDPFFTTRRSEGGTGLGLHIVYNLVTRRLGGRIMLSSAPWRGTTFRITLPLSAPRHEGEAAQAAG